MTDDTIEEKVKKLDDAIKKYVANKIRLESFKPYIEKNDPKSAEKLDDDVDNIQTVIDNLKFARTQLYPKETQTPRPPLKQVPKRQDGALRTVADKTAQQIKKADTVEVSTEVLKNLTDRLESVEKNTTQTVKNTSHSTRNLIVTGIVSFIAGIAVLAISLAYSTL